MRAKLRWTMLIASDLHFGANISEPLEKLVEHALDPARNADRLIVLAGDLTRVRSSSGSRYTTTTA